MWHQHGTQLSQSYKKILINYLKQPKKNSSTTKPQTISTRNNFNSQKHSKNFSLFKIKAISPLEKFPSHCPHEEWSGVIKMCFSESSSDARRGINNWNNKLMKVLLASAILIFSLSLSLATMFYVVRWRIIMRRRRHSRRETDRQANPTFHLLIRTFMYI